MNRHTEIKIAQRLADLEGCEGGDFLHMLCRVAEMLHYASADQEVQGERIMEMIRAEQ